MRSIAAEWRIDSGSQIFQISGSMWRQMWRLIHVTSALTAELSAHRVITLKPQHPSDAAADLEATQTYRTKHVSVAQFLQI